MESETISQIELRCYPRIMTRGSIVFMLFAQMRKGTA